MAPPLTAAGKELRRLHYNRFGTTRGPSDSYKVRRETVAVKRYRELVIKVRGRKRLRPYKNDLGIVIQRLLCEHCLRGDRFVMLMLPGIASGDPSGDWVCAECDPLAAYHISVRGMNDLAIS